MQLSRSANREYTLTIDGANLWDAAEVRLVGLELYTTMGVPQVSDDGRTLRVALYVLPSAPLGVVNVVISGLGWSTPEAAAMQVAVVP